jgi:phage major head subunit gpT-like protein
MKVTPTWVATFETNVQTIIQNVWEETASDLIWDRLMDVKTSGAGRELYFWLIENAGIELQGQGGNQRYDDLAAHFFEIVNEDSGKALELTKNEINDNQMASPMLRGMPALDYAAAWSRDMGYSGAYWPQQRVFDSLIANGLTTAGYDGVNFFSTSHPINVANTGLGTFANLLTGAAVGSYPGACPIDVTNAATLDIAHTNLARAIAYIQSLKGPHNKPRRLKVKYLLAGEDLRKRSAEILTTRYYGTGQGSTENVISTYGIEPLIASELNEVGVYYLVCKWMPGQGGPFVFQNREPYILTSYAPETQVELQRKKKFEWHFNGRNAVAYGHAWLIFRINPT